jgi:hypothetical protein
MEASEKKKTITLPPKLQIATIFHEDSANHFIIITILFSGPSASFAPLSLPGVFGYPLRI